MERLPIFYPAMYGSPSHSIGRASSGTSLWLHSPNGKVVSADKGGGGSLLANRVQVNVWETFKVVTREAISGLEPRYALYNGSPNTVFVKPDDRRGPLSISVPPNKIYEGPVKIFSVPQTGKVYALRGEGIYNAYIHEDGEPTTTGEMILGDWGQPLREQVDPSKLPDLNWKEVCDKAREGVHGAARKTGEERDTRIARTS